MVNKSVAKLCETTMVHRKPQTMMRAGWFAAAIFLIQIVRAPAWAATATVQGNHSMTGTVTMIDHTTGMLTLKTMEGDLKLHFPPPTVQNLKEGDKITVHLSYSASESNAAH